MWENCTLEWIPQVFYYNNKLLTIGPRERHYGFFVFATTQDNYRDFFKIFGLCRISRSTWNSGGYTGFHKDYRNFLKITKISWRLQDYIGLYRFLEDDQDFSKIIKISWRLQRFERLQTIYWGDVHGVTKVINPWILIVPALTCKEESSDWRCFIK